MFDNLVVYIILFLGRVFKWYNELVLIKKN